MRIRSTAAISCGMLGLALLAVPRTKAEAPDFNRQVRPILAAHCFKCHGPDAAVRESGLRLDQRDGAIKELDSGAKAIIPGQPDKSELVRRIFSTDKEEQMPPVAANKPLSPAQKEILKQWIAAGAEYQPHWAFKVAGTLRVPSFEDGSSTANDGTRSVPTTNAIDAFIRAKLREAGLSPSPQADRYTLVRRASLDLIGLPPTVEEADAFVNDAAPDAYERLIDRLLASPAYGERWARRWLDLARYADTNGYEKDRPRSIWPYRDWVIRALNADMPFDQFTIEQLAGDMLAGATQDQRIATGFHRNTMINEEGGIDPLEFRFYAMVDRINTTSTVWMGLTLGCAQCHTHKFDPIPHADYYRQLALLNNADEPLLDVRTPTIAGQRQAIEARIAELTADLPNRFPPQEEWRWQAPKPAAFRSSGGAEGTIRDDGSILVGGKNPRVDQFEVALDVPAGEYRALRLEALVDPQLPSAGPGRTPHGNFVLSEIKLEAGGAAVKLARAEADAAQESFPASGAIDGNAKTGWAIDVGGQWNVNRTATFYFEKPLTLAEPTRCSVRLEQQHGTQHTLGCFRLSLGQPAFRDSRRQLAERSREHLEQKFAAWLEAERGQAVAWQPLKPQAAKSQTPTLTIQDDRSIFSSGDITKRDVYDLAFDTAGLRGITALKLEVLPDERLPKGGPGRIYYEGPPGDFWLSKISASEGPRFKSATHSFAAGNNTAAAAIDDDPQTGWSINGGQGRPHYAVFQFEQPLAEAGELNVQLLFERYYAGALGKFRIWATTDPRGGQARDLPPAIEALLLVPPEKLTAKDRERLLAQFVQVAPELAGQRGEIKKLRDSLPAFPTSLVMHERPAENRRATFRHHRGEFLQPKEQVEPELLSIFPPLPAGAGHDRLSYARWLVSGANPLVGRVTMNRHWAAFFGTGIVRTTEDFGYQGEPPSHPELLDWLAGELPRRGWSIKAMHRLIVTSGTYRQESVQSSKFKVQGSDKAATLNIELGTLNSASIDPSNRLLSHFPRTRLEAELVRDAALRISGLLSTKQGGPSVFPPQPPGITSEGAYGPLAWNVSAGEDRYRRGLYTFAKRTAPYAMFATFDGPSGEACLARREVSNTPLQALTLLNNAALLETAQALGSKAATSGRGSLDERVTDLFRRCLTRPPTKSELALLTKFHESQRQRLAAKELDAAALAGPGEGDAIERGAWTLTARAILNLDEVITKE